MLDRCRSPVAAVDRFELGLGEEKLEALEDAGQVRLHRPTQPAAAESHLGKADQISGVGNVAEGVNLLRRRAPTTGRHQGTARQLALVGGPDDVIDELVLSLDRGLVPMHLQQATTPLRAEIFSLVAGTAPAEGTKPVTDMHAVKRLAGFLEADLSAVLLLVESRGVVLDHPRRLDRGGFLDLGRYAARSFAFELHRCLGLGRDKLTLGVRGQLGGVGLFGFDFILGFDFSLGFILGFGLDFDLILNRSGRGTSTIHRRRNLGLTLDRRIDLIDGIEQIFEAGHIVGAEVFVSVECRLDNTDLGSGLFTQSRQLLDGSGQHSRKLELHKFSSF